MDLGPDTGCCPVDDDEGAGDSCLVRGVRMSYWRSEHLLPKIGMVLELLLFVVIYTLTDRYYNIISSNS